MGLQVRLGNILFVDVECVPQHRTFFDLDDGLKEIWEKKSERLGNVLGMDEATADEIYDNRSGIYAERGKIIVISAGYFAANTDGEMRFRVKSFYGDDEKVLLEEFFTLLNEHYDKNFHKLCGHNIKEFDVPYICRRATVHGLVLPAIIDVGGKKPWEVNHIDTMELWKFGDRKSFVSLDLLCRVMGIETPKDDISGEQVARVYWDEQDLERIKTYCEKDVIATAKLLMKLMQHEQEVIME